MADIEIDEKQDWDSDRGKANNSHCLNMRIRKMGEETIVVWEKRVWAVDLESESEVRRGRRSCIRVEGSGRGELARGDKRLCSPQDHKAASGGI